MDRAYPRERFTQVLLTLCKQLDLRHQGVVDYHLDFAPLVFHGKVASRIRSVRAFGSWARGAQACGNLDLAIEMDNAWAVGPGRGSRELAEQPIDGVQVARAMLGRRPSVRYVSLQSALVGPQAIDPSEMKLIWQAHRPDQPRFDWRRAIAAIPLDPGARRFSSSIICLPSRQEMGSASTTAAAAATSTARAGASVGASVGAGAPRNGGYSRGRAADASRRGQPRRSA